MAQLMQLPLTVSCFSKIQIGFTFLVPAQPGSPGQRAVKRLCVCVYTPELFHLLYTPYTQAHAHSLSLTEMEMEIIQVGLGPQKSTLSD